MKKYIEIGRDYLRKEYNGDLKAAVAACDGIIFDSVEKVQRALDYFNQDGDEKRAEKVLKRHMENIDTPTAKAMGFLFLRPLHCRKDFSFT